MKDVIYRLKELSEYRLKHLPGKHDQRDHAWNRGMGAGGSSGVTMGAYRQSRQSILDQVRNGDISRKDARAQLLQLRNQTSATPVAPAAPVSTPTPTLALRAMPRTIDEAIAELSDDASYTPEQLQYIQDGIQNVKDILADNTDFLHARLSKTIDMLGISSLNMDTIATIIQGLFSTTNIDYIHFDNDDNDNDIHFDNELNNDYKISMDSSSLAIDKSQEITAFSRSVKITDNKIEIKNISAYNNGRLSGIRDLGNAMMRRQAMASMMLHKIVNKPVEVFTSAVTDKFRKGFNKWPKVGYVFKLWQYANILKKFGFQSNNSVDLMQEQNANGQYGYEVWDDIVKEMVSQYDYMEETGRMEYTDLTNPGLQLTIQYGRTGMSKTKDRPKQTTTPPKEQPNRNAKPQYEECDADMDVVNLMWRDIIRQKKGE